MKSDNNRQLEMFSRSGEPVYKKDQPSGNSFFLQIRNHEKLLLIFAGLIISCIISFSLGVEKGKTIASSKTHSRLDLASKKKFNKEQGQIQTKKELAVPKEVAPQETVVENTPAQQQGGYTIQLACYKSRSYADREAKTLKNKGLTPLILEKGEYIVLCVGNYNNRETAKILLPKFKDRYQGCYIREL